MQRRSFAGALFFLFLALLPLESGALPEASSEWQREALSDFGDYGHGSDLTVDLEGRLHLLYFNKSLFGGLENDKLIYQKRENNAWIGKSALRIRGTEEAVYSLRGAVEVLNDSVFTAFRHGNNLILDGREADSTSHYLWLVSGYPYQTIESGMLGERLDMAAGSETLHLVYLQFEDLYYRPVTPDLAAENYEIGPSEKIFNATSYSPYGWSIKGQPLIAVQGTKRHVLYRVRETHFSWRGNWFKEKIYYSASGDDDSEWSRTALVTGDRDEVFSSFPDLFVSEEGIHGCYLNKTTGEQTYFYSLNSEEPEFHFVTVPVSQEGQKYLDSCQVLVFNGEPILFLRSEPTAASDEAPLLVAAFFDAASSSWSFEVIDLGEELFGGEQKSLSAVVSDGKLHLVYEVCGFRINEPDCSVSSLKYAMRDLTPPPPDPATPPPSSSAANDPPPCAGDSCDEDDGDPGSQGDSGRSHNNSGQSGFSGDSSADEDEEEGTGAAEPTESPAPKGGCSLIP